MGKRISKRTNVRSDGYECLGRLDGLDFDDTSNVDAHISNIYHTFNCVWPHSIFQPIFNIFCADVRITWYTVLCVSKYMLLSLHKIYESWNFL